MPSDEFVIRRTFVLRFDTVEEQGRAVSPPLRRVVSGAIVNNPYAGRYVDDLSDAVAFSVSLGTMLATTGLAVLDEPAQSYGKGGIAGVAGEQEHAVMLMTTPFGDAVRDVLGGGKAWIPSASRVGAAGSALSLPLAHKDALYVRSHYDAITFAVDDGPRPDEVLVAVGLANRGRPHERLGGLKATEIRGQDGLL